MPRARRGFLAAAASLCLAAAVAAIATGNKADAEPAVVARDEGGRELLRVALPSDRRFALAYRNSLYEADTEERFAATRGDRFRLVALASESVAVLEEYYGVDGGPVDAGLAGERLHRHRLTRPRAFRELRIVATELGRRTLIVGSRRAELWRLVPDGEIVVLTVEPR
jgi:hypothetical protein